MSANACDARTFLRQRLDARRPLPFVPIQCFDLPFNEYLVSRPLPATDKDEIMSHNMTFDDLVPHMKRAGFLAAALAAVITSMFGWGLGENLLAKISLAGLLALCTFIVSYALVAAYHAYKRDMPAVSAAATGLFLVAVCVEFLSHTGFTAANRDATAQAAMMQTTSYEDSRGNVDQWQATLASLRADRSKMQPARSAADARAVIDSSKAHKFWSSTDACKETSGPKSRTFCETYNAAQADIALWDTISVQDGRIADAQAKLEQARASAATQVAGHSSGASQGLILAAMATGSEKPGETAVFWSGVGISALLALFAICASGLLNFIAFAFDGTVRRLEVVGGKVTEFVDREIPVLDRDTLAMIASLKARIGHAAAA